MPRTIITETTAEPEVFVYPAPLLTAINLINYCSGIVNFLLGMRLILKFFGANPVTPIVALLYNTTNFLLSPFRGIFPTVAEGRNVLEPTTLVAMIFYTIIFYGIVQLLMLLAREQRA